MNRRLAGLACGLVAAALLAAAPAGFGQESDTAGSESEQLVPREETGGESGEGLAPTTPPDSETDGLANRKVRTVVVRPDGTIITGDEVTAGGEPRPAADIEVTIGEVEALDSSIAADDLRDILSGNIAGHADAIAHLSADTILVPEVVVSITPPVELAGAAGATVRFQDFRIVDAEDGVADSVALGALTLDSEDFEYRFGPMSAQSVDFGAMLGFYGLVDREAEDEFRTLYTELTIEGAALAARDLSCSIGPYRAGETRVRPTATSIVDLLAFAAAVDEDATRADPALAAELFRGIIELANAFETEPSSYERLTCSATTGAREVIDIAVGEIEIGGISGPRYPRISINDVSIEAADGAIRLGNLTIKPIDYANFLAAFAAADAELDESWFEEHARELMPEAEGATLSGLRVDIPDEGDRGQRITGSVATFDLSLGGYRNGVPTVASTMADGVVVEIPTAGGDAFAKTLSKAGFTTLDTGFSLSARWDEPSGTILVDSSVSGVKLGSLAVSMLLGEAGPALFDVDPDVATRAAEQLTLKSFDIEAVNEGMLELGFTLFAEEQGIEPAEVPFAASSLTQALVFGFFGTNPRVPELSAALDTFLKGGRSFRAHFEATGAAGVRLTAMEALRAQPGWLADKFTIEAAAD